MFDKNKILLTKSGEKKLREELKNLIDIVRPEVIQELKEARAQGDLSENADYDAARNRQAEVEGRIREIEDSLSHIKIIKEKDVNRSQKKIKLGSNVTYVKYEKGKISKKMKVKIVGIVESDPEKQIISNESPLAKAIIGKTIGDSVEIKTPKKTYKIKIDLID